MFLKARQYNIESSKINFSKQLSAFLLRVIKVDKKGRTEPEISNSNH